MQSATPGDGDGGLLRQFRRLACIILHHTRAGVPLIRLLKDVSEVLIETSGCDAVEWWIKEGGGFFNCELSKDDSGLRWEVNHLDVVDPLGSLIVGTHDERAVARVLADLNAAFPSVVLIPLSDGAEKIAYFHLKSRQANKFSPEDAEFYDVVAETLALALTGHSTHAKLRERVKELSCLYAVVRLAEQPGVSLEAVLRGIVDLIPPAWQYPDITAAHIDLDGEAYATPRYGETPWRQSADIVVGGTCRGRIDVVYLEERPHAFEGPFLGEERHLIDALTGEIAGIIDRRQVREEMARLESQLRHSDRLATLGQLAAGVAHELNEPLSGILGFAQLVQKANDLPEPVRQDLGKVVDASLYCRKIINKLRLFSQQAPPELTAANLNAVIEGGLTFLRARCANQNIRITEELDPHLPEIVADQGQLHQVLVNLVVNAVQAMPDGGVLTIRTKAVEGAVALVVEDTGIGMSEQVMEKIFTPFFTTKSVNEGTGLGLSVVHGIVTAHGGTIQAQSQIGRGSKFEARFPVRGVRRPKNPSE